MDVNLDRLIDAISRAAPRPTDRRFTAACAALTGLMPNVGGRFEMDPRSYAALAKEAIAHADALLAALASEPKL